MAYRRSTRIRRSMPRRRLFWARDTQLSTFGGDTDPNSRIRNLLTNYETVAGSDVEGTTVTRIRGHIRVQPFAAFTSPVNYTVGFKVDDSWPTGTLEPEEVDTIVPATFPYSDWMYVRNNWMDPILADPEDSATARMQTDQLTKVIEIDLKSQRRFDEVQQSLYLFHGFTDAGGAALPDSALVMWDLHILLKRP